MIKTALSLALVLSACSPYPAPVAPAASPQPPSYVTTTESHNAPPLVASPHHLAAETFLRSKSGQGAKCDPITTTPVYDDAFCELPNGAQLVCWHEQPGGFGCYGLYSPPPPPPPPAAVEATKKK